mgnify:CR=1 FL=1
MGQSGSRINYDVYIRSDEWKEFRKGYFQRHEKKCRVCGSAHNIQLHHITYERLGNEADDDLAPLCEGCHDEVHGLIRARFRGDPIRHLQNGCGQAGGVKRGRKKKRKSGKSPKQKRKLARQIRAQAEKTEADGRQMTRILDEAVARRDAGEKLPLTVPVAVPVLPVSPPRVGRILSAYRRQQRDNPDPTTGIYSGQRRVGKKQAKKEREVATLERVCALTAAQLNALTWDEAAELVWGDKLAMGYFESLKKVCTKPANALLRSWFLEWPVPVVPAHRRGRSIVQSGVNNRRAR